MSHVSVCHSFFFPSSFFFFFLFLCSWRRHTARTGHASPAHWWRSVPTERTGRRRARLSWHPKCGQAGSSAWHHGRHSRPSQPPLSVLSVPRYTHRSPPSAPGPHVCLCITLCVCVDVCVFVWMCVCVCRVHMCVLSSLLAHCSLQIWLNIRSKETLQELTVVPVILLCRVSSFKGYMLGHHWRSAAFQLRSALFIALIYWSVCSLAWVAKS